MTALTADTVRKITLKAMVVIAAAPVGDRLWREQQQTDCGRDPALQVDRGQPLAQVDQGDHRPGQGEAHHDGPDEDDGELASGQEQVADAAVGHPQRQ